jgi:hypothetical protein
LGWTFGWRVTAGMVHLLGGSPSTQEDPCREFYVVLDEVPHVALTSMDGPIESMWSGEPTAVCEVAFETTDSTLAGEVPPTFVAGPGSETHRAGWRMIPEIVADGPGSGVHGIQRNGVRCVIRWEQPAYIDDDGNFVQSSAFSMRIQCGTTGLPRGSGLRRAPDRPVSAGGPCSESRRLALSPEQAAATGPRILCPTFEWGRGSEGPHRTRRGP